MSSLSESTLRKIGKDEENYFFGYYNKTNWDISRRYILAHQVPLPDHKIEPHLVAKIGYFDTQNDDEFIVLGETTSWNWQMGAQLQWLETADKTSIIYNVRTDDDSARYPRLGSAIIDATTGERRLLPMPIYSVAPNAEWALSVDYRRLWITHQTIGYCCSNVKMALELYPETDGIYRIDLATGDARLLVSYQALRDFHPRSSMARAIHWVSHIEINPSSSRILFLHRWTERVADETCFLHRLITMNPDGSELRLLECSDHPLPQLDRDFDTRSVGIFDYEKSEYQISHPLWRDDTSIIAWSPHAGEIHYHLYQDQTEGAVEVIGRGVLVENGHMSFCPTNPRWLLSDTYPDAGTSTHDLFLYDMATGDRTVLAQLYTDPGLGKENRCDLHPRWRPDGQAICIDSIHDGERRLYLLDLAKVITTKGMTSG